MARFQWRAEGHRVADTKDKAKAKSSYHHGDLRQALIDGAVELIAEGQIEGLSLRGLARKVGVSYAAPYHHFADKTALLAEVSAQGFERLDREMAAQSADCRHDPKLVFRADGRAYLNFAVNHPAHYRVMFHKDLAKSDDFPNVQCAADGCFTRLLTDTRALLGDAVSEEEIAEIASVVWATVHGAATLWNDGPMQDHLGEASLEQFVELITGQVIAMLEALRDTRQRSAANS